MLRGRSDQGHWFGTVIDAPDPQALGMFYHQVLGWEIHKNQRATLADFQPQKDVRVLLDPAGHPFCLYADS